MKKNYLVLAFLFFSFSTIFAQSDRSPFHSTYIPPLPISPNTIFDVQFNYDLGATVGLGNAGAEFDGQWIWVAKWSTSYMYYRFSTSGVKRDSFTINVGASNVRDLAWDGKYMYGGAAAGPSIVRIDTGSKTVVKTINTSVASIRAIAWDPVLKGFWVCGWADAIVCVDTNGVLIPGKSITNTYVAKYGLAYDGYSAGGPFLWVFDQTNTAGGSPQALYKWDLNTLTYTGVSFDVTTVITNGGAAAIAGGLFIAQGIVPGKSTIGGVLQGTPDRLFGLELTTLGPAITHTPLQNTTNVTGPFPVNCQVIPTGSSITSAKIFWSRNNPVITDSVTMSHGTGNNWSGNIPGNGLTATYRYYLWAKDSINRTVTLPGNAPTTLFSFVANSNDTVKPVIIHTAFGPTPKSYWPLTVTANVTDNIGVDSVWVEWYKNTPTIIKEFKLLPVGSNNYSAVFNSINSDVNVGDVIYYKIKSDDISSNHNVASLPLTGYFSFGIITLKVCEGFNTTTFPPTNWTITGTASTYWSYNAVSGYMLGTGSARFNYYSATSGTSAQLNTYQFDPSPVGDSIKFSLAQAYYSATLVDTLRIYTSTDAGTTWNALWTLWGQTNFTDPHSLSTVSQTGLFVPTSASQWKTMAYLLPTGTNKLRFDAVSGYGNDMFLDSICMNSSLVGIGNNENTIPLVYTLSQNYPNPFNPVTQIRFGIPKQGLVTMRVYDVLGREVAKLVNEIKAPGSYTVDFDGSKLSSGVYFYRLEANGFVEVKKMMLIK